MTLGFLRKCLKGFIDVSIVPLKTLKNGSFSLSHILLFPGYAVDGINQIGTLTCKVRFAIVCGSCGHAGDFPTMIRVRTIPTFFGLACILNEVGDVSNLSK